MACTTGAQQYYQTASTLSRQFPELDITDAADSHHNV